MKLFLKLASVTLALSVFIAFSSCEKQVASDDLAEVSFSINNLTNSLLKKAPPSGDDGGWDMICVDGTPTTVEVEIELADAGGILFLTLDVLTQLEDGNQTKVVKLPPGTHTVTSFAVFNENGEPMYASPVNGSDAQTTFGLKGVDFTFETVAFQKKKVTVDVICYVPYKYEEFGFNWFEFAPIEIKTVCFFGDVCTKFYERWHTIDPYKGEPYDGYDFPAKYTLNIWSADAQGNPIEIINSMDNYEIDGPICIEYPDYVNVPDENFVAQIVLATPNGPVSILVPFTDADWSDPANNGFGGADGIFDFVYSMDGLCDDNDSDLVIIPSQVPQ